MTGVADIVPAATIGTVCQAYADSKMDLQEGFRLLHQTDKRLKAILVSEYPHFLPDGWYLHDDTCAKSIDRVKRDCWWYIYRQTRVWEICSIKQREKLEKEAREGELPEVTEPNVLAFLEKLQANLPDMFEQALKEVFDWLRPQRGWGAEYKTNNEFAIGKKVILGYCVDLRWNRHFDVYYGKKQHLQALDNVFHLLDGRGIARYPNDLVTAIDTQGAKGLQACETDYFLCKWFCNGNLHITFKRVDLVHEINRRAGASGLNTYTPKDGAIVRAGAADLGGNDHDDNKKSQQEDRPGADAGLGGDAGAQPEQTADAGAALPPEQASSARAALPPEQASSARAA